MKNKTEMKSVFRGKYNKWHQHDLFSIGSWNCNTNLEIILMRPHLIWSNYLGYTCRTLTSMVCDFGFTIFAFLNSQNNRGFLVNIDDDQQNVINTGYYRPF